MALDRTGFNAWVDDDGTGTTGTLLTKARFDSDLLDPIDADCAFTNASNEFTGDQTIDGDLIVTGEINPTVRAAQAPKIDQLIGPRATAGSRTLMSRNLISGLSLRHDEETGHGQIACGNYDTQLYEPLRVEVESFQVHSGISPAARVEHLRVHPSGGVTIGGPATHATDPGIGQLTVEGFGASPLATPAARGLLPALSGDPAQVLNGEGHWVMPPQPASFLAYGFDPLTTEPPAAFTCRVNAGHPYTAVTKVWITFQNSNREDLYFMWMRVPRQSLLLVQDKDNHAQHAQFTVVGEPIDKGTYCEIPVTWQANGTALAKQDCLVRAVDPGTSTIAALEARLAALEARLAAIEGRC